MRNSLPYYNNQLNNKTLFHHLRILVLKRKKLNLANPNFLVLEPSDLQL